MPLGNLPEKGTITIKFERNKKGFKTITEITDVSTEEVVSAAFKLLKEIWKDDAPEVKFGIAEFVAYMRANEDTCDCPKCVARRKKNLKNKDIN